MLLQHQTKKTVELFFSPEIFASAIFTPPARFYHCCSTFKSSVILGSQLFSPYESLKLFGTALQRLRCKILPHQSFYSLKSIWDYPIDYPIITGKKRKTFISFTLWICKNIVRRKMCISRRDFYVLYKLFSDYTLVDKYSKSQISYISFFIWKKFWNSILINA